ncbi:hypothetical protein ABN763_12095 [Spongiivirga sp. MCCC 1A20706]|uniref:hypothetical protein n=1 Tax=Spongiivirga sp. MCCC 1A20706 TaxID=3160963 RepID=UPI0039773B0F
MKLYKLLFASTLLLFISCNSDDTESDVNTDTNSLVGTWDTSSIETEGTTAISLEGISISTTFTGTSKDEDLAYTFTENTISFEGGYTTVLTISVPGQDPITEEAVVPDSNGSTTYILENGNTLVLGEDFFNYSDSSGVEIAENVQFDENSTVIKSISETTMVIESVSKGTYEQQGATVEFDLKATATLTKVN